MERDYPHAHKSMEILMVSLAEATVRVTLLTAFVTGTPLDEIASPVAKLQ